MHTLIILCANYLIWGIVLVGFIYLLQSHKRKRIVLYGVVALPVTYLVGKIAGIFWYDPRPFVSDGITPLILHAADNGFPSDHMLLGGAIASVVFAYNRPLGIVLWIMAIVVGAARVFAGVHHWADIAGGAVIAIIVSWAVWRALHHYVA